MKGPLRYILSLFIFFGAGYVSSGKIPKLSPLFKSQKQQFKPNPYPIYNQSFAVLVIGENNKEHVEKTLRSVFSQNYGLFRVIYIDNGSTDESFTIGKDFVSKNEFSEKVSFIKNIEPLGEFQNLLQAAEMCSKDEILVIVQGKDMLSHDWVLQKLNQYYADPNLWLATTNSLELSTFTSTPKTLQTFYASIIKNIVNDYAVDPEEGAYREVLIDYCKEHSQHISENFYLVEPPILEDEPCDL